MAKRRKPRGNPDQLIATTRGTKIFRSDLAQKVARANQVLKQVQAEAKGTEFGQYKKQVLPPTMIKKGKLGIRGITDPGKLSAIEAAAEKIIKGGGYKKVKEIREDRYRKMSETFKKDWGLTQEEVDLLNDMLFKSPEWETLKQTYLLDSEQRARIMHELVIASRTGYLKRNILKETLQALAWESNIEDASLTPPDFSNMDTGWETPEENWDNYTTTEGPEVPPERDETVSKAQQILDAIRRMKA